jgi:Ca2+-binding RTX toxin-like protein
MISQLFPTRSRVFVAGLFLAVSTAGGALLQPMTPLYAGLEEGDAGAQVLIGKDNDNTNNPLIQPAGVAANQSLNNTDILSGGSGPDVLIGLLGSDVLFGNAGNDILIGGTEQGSAPNSDVMFGGAGNDVNIWAAGDGSEIFIGGPGTDALVFGAIDRANNVPTLTDAKPGHPTGVPTAALSTQGGFCTLETVTDPALGYDFLVRFFVRATGSLAVTVRTSDVEQVFCTSQAGGAITYANLRDYNPQFVEVSLEQVNKLNKTVGQIVR